MIMNYSSSGWIVKLSHEDPRLSWAKNAPRNSIKSPFLLLKSHEFPMNPTGFLRLARQVPSLWPKKPPERPAEGPEGAMGSPWFRWDLGRGFPPCLMALSMTKPGDLTMKHSNWTVKNQEFTDLSIKHGDWTDRTGDLKLLNNQNWLVFMGNSEQ